MCTHFCAVYLSAEHANSNEMWFFQFLPCSMIFCILIFSLTFSLANFSHELIAGENETTLKMLVKYNFSLEIEYGKPILKFANLYQNIWSRDLLFTNKIDQSIQIDLFRLFESVVSSDDYRNQCHRSVESQSMPLISMV